MEQLVVELAAVHQAAVLEELLAVIGGDHDQQVFAVGRAQLLERGAEAVVHGQDLAVVEPDHHLALRRRRAGRSLLDQVEELAHAHAARSLGPGRGEEVEARRRRVGMMHGVVVQEGEEGRPQKAQLAQDLRLVFVRVPPALAPLEPPIEASPEAEVFGHERVAHGSNVW